MKKELKKFAESLLSRGFSVIPTKGKMPVCSWGKFQNLALTTKEFNILAEKGDSIAVICGRDGLFCIDFDNKNERDFSIPQPQSPTLQRIVEIFGAPTLALANFVEFCNQLPESILAKSYVEKTPSGGLHLFIKAKNPIKTSVIKKSEDGKVEIETRADGAYAVIAPSPGYTNLFNTLDNVEKITEDENLNLLNLIFAYNNLGGGYEKILKLLVDAGWRVFHENAKFIYLTRPGKETGNSGTIFKDTGIFYVFSTNAPPFEANRGYTPREVRSLLIGNKLAGAKLKKAERIIELEERLRELGVFRFDVLKGVYTLNGKRVTDRDFNKLFVDVSKEGSGIPFDIFLKVIDYIAEDTNPVREFFEQLEPCERDTITPLCGFIKTTPANILVDFLKRFMVACVAQVLARGRNDFILIFIGAQGIGKSSFLRFLAPPELREYVAEFSIFERSKDVLLTAAGSFLTILDDLEAQTPRDSAFLKSVITSENLSFRRPYGKTIVTTRRVSSFVASMNRQKFLNDPTGSRRFLVALVDAIDFKVFDYDITSAWMHAKYLLESGFKYWLDSEETKKIQMYNEFFEAPTRESELLFLLLTEDTEKEVVELTATQLLMLIEAKGIKNLSLRNIGMGLQRLGFAPKIKKVGGKTAQVYSLPLPKYLLASLDFSPSLTHLITRN